MKSGYPRFKIHPDCAALFKALAARYGWPVEAGDAATSMAFPNRAAAERCVEFVVARDVDAASVRLEALRLVPQQPGAEAAGRGMLDAPVDVYTVLFPAAAAPIAKQFWQHTGEGISSRLASHILEILRSADTASIGVNTSASSNTSANVSSNVSANTNTSANASANTSASAGPAPPATRRPGYHRRPTVAAAAASSTSSATSTASASTPSQTSPQTSSQTVSPHAAAQQPDASSDVGTFIEERFGRNISIGLAEDAKLAIRRRIAGIIGRADGQHDEQQLRGAGVSERDVWLYPCGMNAIYHAHRILKRALGDRSAARGVVFGFVYTDTLKVLEKFGPQPAAGNSAMFFGHGDGADYDALEAALAAERVLAIFTECPSNPLLKTADLARLRRIADANGCALVVDETLGNFSNINVLPYADVVVSSLTKVFSGDSNVMGGSLVV
ncbi:PLP-dependent transferase, partial [Ramicandelaber brevisporus]